MAQGEVDSEQKHRSASTHPLSFSRNIRPSYKAWVLVQWLFDSFSFLLTIYRNLIFSFFLFFFFNEKKILESNLV